MTRAASSRKNSTGNTVNTKPGAVFRGRDVVFVDPLDEKEIYWWPAMIVPIPEIDSSMGCTILDQGECLVKYFEDNKYSVVKFSDLQHFIPTTIPYIQFEETAGQKFLKNGGVVNAMTYLDTGKVKRKFSWHRWGSAQDQELSLDMLKHKSVNLPLISDESFQDMQQQIHSSSIMSSPTTSSKNYIDSETDTRDNVSSSSSSADERAPTSRGHQKNGHRQPTGVSSSSSSSSQSSNNLLPSPVSLNDPSTESMDETDFSIRSTRTKVEGTASKDSPIISRSRSRRGSRDTESKTSIDSTSDKESSKRSRNASDQSLSSSTSSSNSLSSTFTPQNVSNNTSELVSTETTKKRKTNSEQTNIQIKTSDIGGSLSAKSSRQGSLEPSSSPRSTRHSFRGLKLSENGQQSPNEDIPGSPQDGTAAGKLQTHRMTRQRSSPKSSNSNSILPPPSTLIAQEKLGGVIGEPTTQELSKNGHPIEHSLSDDSTAMDVDAQESSTESNPKDQSSSTAASDSTVSSTPSPSSTGPEEIIGMSTSSLPSTHRELLLSLEQDRREMDYSFGHVLPTLAIGSKEREAFYETCMDHLQKLRQEHRKLKDILKHSDYVPQGRRATRSLPHQHRNGHHHLEEKPNRKNSPAPTRSNSAKKMDLETSDESTSSPMIQPQPYQGSAPSSAILTSNISTSTRRSAATAAAAAVTATVSRASRQSNNNNSNNGSSQSNTDKIIESSYGKKRGSATAAAVAAAAAEAAALAAANDNSTISTRAKRRQR